MQSFSRNAIILELRVVGSGHAARATKAAKAKAKARAALLPEAAIEVAAACATAALTCAVDEIVAAAIVVAESDR